MIKILLAIQGNISNRTKKITRINIRKKGKIKALVYLSNHLQDTKSFKEMTKQDILDHLNTFRKIQNNNNVNNQNPSNNYNDNKWIGNNNNTMIKTN